MYLEDITKENRDQALALRVKSDQEGFIETVEQCLKESDELILWKPVGIYEDDVMIGFAMYGMWYEENQERVWLDRFLIDEKHQGKGLGKKALKTVMTYIFLEYNCKKIYLSLYQNNSRAMRLYKEFGFRKNGEKDINGEEVMVLEM